MELESSDRSMYLHMNDVVDGYRSELAEVARKLTQGLDSDVAEARAIFEWVRDEIPHSHDIGIDVVTCSASEVLRERTGICYAKSHLFAALTRAVGIPTGFCYQVYLAEPETGKTAVHAFNAVYLASHRRWLRLDARGNTGEIDAQFDLERERLAFPVDPDKGELFIYDGVFCEPAPEVVEALRRHKRRSELWLDLPELLADERLCPADREKNQTVPRRRRVAARSPRAHLLNDS
jgi:hypothetical protein